MASNATKITSLKQAKQFGLAERFVVGWIDVTQKRK